MANKEQQAKFKTEKEKFNKRLSGLKDENKTLKVVNKNLSTQNLALKKILNNIKKQASVPKRV